MYIKPFNRSAIIVQVSLCPRTKYLFIHMQVYTVFVSIEVAIVFKFLCLKN